MKSSIKWGCIQPLTGGMYIGAKEATGCDAQWILSYPGLNSPVIREGKVVNSGNEYNLTEYLKKHNCMPNYYLFDRQMFQNDMNMNPTIKTETGETVTPDYKDLDLVVAVPVCSGLSTATICDSEVKAVRNCNMLYLANYALRVIQPKVYIFENAPTLFSSRGDEIREQLQTLALENGYTVAYYKTDTHLHHNCQKRPRTFVLFFKGKRMPTLEFENAPVPVEEFLSKIPADATQQVNFEESFFNTIPMKYAEYKFGKDWRKEVGDGDVFAFATKNDETMDEFLVWLDANGTDIEKEKLGKYIQHIKDKRAMNKGYWVASPKIYSDYVPACMYKNIWSLLHYKENRLYNEREWLSVMGMPYDFEMQGEYVGLAGKIGQNVPVGTAKFIVEQAIKHITGQLDETERQCVAFDNIKQKITEIA